MVSQFKYPTSLQSTEMVLLTEHMQRVYYTWLHTAVDFQAICKFPSFREHV